VFAEIIAAAADYEQSSRTHLMARSQRQFGHAAAQNLGICSQVSCRGRPSVNREYSAGNCAAEVAAADAAQWPESAFL